MYENVTVDDALKKGRTTITVPVLCIMLGLFLLSGLLFIQFEFSAPALVTCLVASFVIPWLYWSVMITRWRIWALENVRNVHELKKRAIKEQLIWKDGSFFEKTEIRTTADKEKLYRLQDKFNKPDVFTDDIVVPGETMIYYSRNKAIAQLMIVLVMAGSGVCLLTIQSNWVVGAALIVIALIMAYGAVKKLNNKLPQVILSNKGIQTGNNPFYGWQQVHNEDVIAVQAGKTRRYFLIYNSPLGKEKIDIAGFDINRRRLEHLLRIYRGRANHSALHH